MIDHNIFVSSSSSSSDSDDEAVFVNIVLPEIQKHRQKMENYFENIVPNYKEDEFIEHFRVSREVIISLAQKYEESVHFPKSDTGNERISSDKCMLIFCWYAGHEAASFRDVADRFDISISTLHIIIRRISHFLSGIAGEIIKWPSEVEAREIEINFSLKGFPGVIGCMDGTHIRIDKPAEDSDSYINRNKYYSIQMPPRNQFFLLCVIIACTWKYSASQSSTTIDPAVLDKIKDIFGEPDSKTVNTTEPSVNLDECECVNYYLCNGTHINTNGEGIIDIRIDEGKCESYLEFCCLPPNKVTDPIRPYNETKRTGCGWRNPNGAGVVTIGDDKNESKFGEFPWMVAILREEQLNGQMLNVYQCGGSLIHPKAVITAAHCVNNKERTYYVRAGEWDTQTTKEILPHQNRKVQSITVHPEFYSGALYYDVALVVLDKPFDLDQHINVACLPTAGTVVPSKTNCWASGWGKDLFGADGKYQVIMKKIGLPIVDHNTCQENLRTTRLGKYFVLHESFVCAGGEAGIDTCQGDGGSPLVCPIPGQTERYQHIGIVSWGIGCGENNIPGVYANMPLFRNWIDKEMTKNNLDISQYQY